MAIIAKLESEKPKYDPNAAVPVYFRLKRVSAGQVSIEASNDGGEWWYVGHFRESGVFERSCCCEVEGFKKDSEGRIEVT